MKLSKIGLLLLIITLAFLPNQSSWAQSAANKTILQPGEELEYEVSFYNIKLGKIRVVTEESVDYKGVRVFRTKAFMESYPGIPFIDLNAIYSSWIDPTVSFSYQFEGNFKLDANKWQFQRIVFDYDKNQIVNEKWEDKVPTESLTTKNTQKINDGGSLFFLARQYTNMKRTVRIPTLIDTKIGTTFINFHGKRENITIPAIKYPVKCIFFDGRAEWEGVYGLSGKFEGWFSDDDARVPIRAKMNVYVGSVVIELIKWKREGWTPPRG